MADRMNFARNPEEMRQEAERRRQEKMARSGKKYPPPQQRYRYASSSDFAVLAVKLSRRFRIEKYS